jgi:hypothetical protein
MERAYRRGGKPGGIQSGGRTFRASSANFCAHHRWRFANSASLSARATRCSAGNCSHRAASSSSARERGCQALATRAKRTAPGARKRPVNATGLEPPGPASLILIPERSPDRRRRRSSIPFARCTVVRSRGSQPDGRENRRVAAALPGEAARA